MKVCLTCSTRFDGDDWVCPGCGGHPREVADGIRSFAVPASELDYEAAFFAELAAVEEASFWFRTRNKLLVWSLTRYFPSARSFLEVGCGNGFVLRGMRDARPDVHLTGAELFREGLATARLRLADISLLQADARALPFDAEFDVVGAFDVLEHIDEDDEVLRQMRQAVRPGGGILVTVPQHSWLWSAADEYARHKRRYSRKKLVVTARSTGLEIVHVTSFISLLVPVLALSRWQHRSIDARYDPMAEIRRSARADHVLERLVDAELALTRRGFAWPAGGSLLLVARRPGESS